MIHRPHCLVGVGSAVLFLPSPREGAERRKGAGNSLAPWEVPRAVVTRHARLPALHCGDFGPDHRVFFQRTGGVHLTLSGPHWRGPSSEVVQATEGGPLIGAGR